MLERGLTEAFLGDTLCFIAIESLSESVEAAVHACKIVLDVHSIEKLRLVYGLVSLLEGSECLEVQFHAIVDHSRGGEGGQKAD